VSLSASAQRLRLARLGDPRLTLAPLCNGPADPTMRIERDVIVRATRLASGPAAFRLRPAGETISVEAWGTGADEALAGLPRLLGQADDPGRLVPHDPLVSDLARRFAGLRLTRGAQPIEVLVPAILAQKVTGREARLAQRQLVLRFGERAPGPLNLRLPPSPATLAALPYYELHPLGIERRRADTIRHAAGAADMLASAARRDERDELRRRLLALPGVGPWTMAETLRIVLGDPDAVTTGDYNLPALVGWTLAGERRAGDARMLELLEPYRGQRARVVMLLELGGRYPPRRGPRFAPRSIAAI
jgi:3-methyladenine DNA glycosylase/8-oxoguanine DNA glycosylase